MRALIFVFLLPLVACSGNGDADQPGVAPAGSGTSRTYLVADFARIDLRGATDVDVRTGTGFSVRAEGESDVLDRLRVVREGDELQISRREASGWRFGRREGVRVFVTMPRLTAASVTGSGDLTVDRIEGEAFAGNVEGSGSVTVQALATARAQLRLVGSGDVSAAGNVRRLQVSVDGSGTVNAPRLTAGEADVSVSGSGDVRAAVRGPASVSLAGSGSVDLGAAARCATSLSGSGEVRCGY